MTTTDTPRTDAYTDHATDHATDHDCDVSLIEQLKSVPLKSRELIKDEKGLGLTNIPYGRYCQDAAAALQKANAEVERLRNGMQGSCYCCEPVGEMNQKPRQRSRG
jgi:hypothetical protein